MNTIIRQLTQTVMTYSWYWDDSAETLISAVPKANFSDLIMTETRSFQASGWGRVDLVSFISNTRDTLDMPGNTN